ncbi:MAG TPA: energy transducer TonB [Steroidobacteraceae bacterium]|jgi:TonB family protein|nr:energy transducer TonB [Steroidobacteraceae bacterium]
MKTNTIVSWALAVAGLAAAALAHAGFTAALGDYKAGRYDTARSQFGAMAELGDCSSQFNLGLMTLKGQGGPKDPGAAVGWLQAAASNGCQELVGGSVASLQGSLSDQQRRAAADIVAHYGHDALRAAGIVQPQLDCPAQASAAVLEAPTAEYPPALGAAPRNGLVIGRLTIGVDGRARDPEILLSAPDPAFAAAAVEAWLNSRFQPAMQGGVPVESRLQVRLAFSVAGAEPLWASSPYKDSRSAAEAGDPAAEYLVGLASLADSTVGVAAARGRDLLIFSARDGNPQAQYWLAAQQRAAAACHPQVSGAAWLEHAAKGGDTAAQLLLATQLLSGSPSEAQVSEARGLLERAAATDDYYVRKHVAALLAASPLAAVRDPATARQVAGRLASGDIQSDPQMFEVLAAAAAAGGDFDGAVSQQETAVHKARDLRWNTRAMEQRLSAYRDHRAWQGGLLAAAQ